MATQEERLLILRMVQEKKITTVEAAQLLEALEDRRVTDSSSPAADTQVEKPRAPRWLRVRVTDAITGRQRLNLRLPTGLVSSGMKLGTRLTPEIDGLDMNRILAAIAAGEVGEIIDVVDEEDGEHVEVFLE